MYLADNIKDLEGNINCDGITYFDNKERRGKLISFTTGSPLRPIPVSLEDILLKEVNELLLGFLWTFDFSTFNSF